MLNQRSFSEILSSLTDSESFVSGPNPANQSQRTQDFSAGWESHLEPFGLAQLIAEVHIKPARKPPTHRIYPKKKVLKAASARPNHCLNEAEQQALAFLKTFSPSIKGNFNLHELKSAYRLSALKTHPDQGGSSETFQEAKKSYHILSALVKN